MIKKAAVEFDQLLLKEIKTPLFCLLTSIQLEAKELHGLIDEFGKTYLKNEATFQESFLACQITELVDNN